MVKHFCDLCGLEKSTSELFPLRVLGGGEPPLYVLEETCTVCWGAIKAGLIPALHAAVADALRVAAEATLEAAKEVVAADDAKNRPPDPIPAPVPVTEPPAEPPADEPPAKDVGPR